MLTAWHNNVQILYLPPHTSHVTQPLDVSGFSPVKRQYRREIEELSTLDESAPVKKARFLEIYARSRTNGFSVQTILGGWRGAGLVPFNPDKVLQSSQVRIEPLTSLVLRSNMPQITYKRRRSTSITTPSNRRDVQALKASFTQEVGNTRTIRRLFEKVGKGMDNLHNSKAFHSRQITSL